jgi:transposase-like protein
MESSKLKLRDWLMAMTFMSATKQGFSTLEMKRQMGFSRYETVFRMVHKLRVAMGKRDETYNLEDMVEYDEAFVGTVKKAEKKKKLKRGKGSQKKSSVAVMAESSILEDPKTGELTKSCRYFKMKKIENLKAKTAEKLIKGLIEKDSVLQTDRSNTYADFEDFLEVHVQDISSSNEGKFNLKWVHTAISNLKSDLRKYRMVSEKLLQNYLDEFCYKLNRRYFGERLFDRLVIASIQPYWQDCG